MAQQPPGVGCCRSRHPRPSEPASPVLPVVLVGCMETPCKPLGAGIEAVCRAWCPHSRAWLWAPGAVRLPLGGQRRWRMLQVWFHQEGAGCVPAVPAVQGKACRCGPRARRQPAGGIRAAGASPRRYCVPAEAAGWAPLLLCQTEWTLL